MLYISEIPENWKKTGLHKAHIAKDSSELKSLSLVTQFKPSTTNWSTEQLQIDSTEATAYSHTPYYCQEKQRGFITL